MAKLMRDIATESVRGEGEGAAEGAPATEEERQREAAFRKAWEEMLVEGMNGALGQDDHMKMRDPSAEGPPDLNAADPFQSSIKKAMEKLKVAEEAKVCLHTIADYFLHSSYGRMKLISLTTMMILTRSPNSSRTSARAARSQKKSYKASSSR